MHSCRNARFILGNNNTYNKNKEIKNNKLMKVIMEVPNIVPPVLLDIVEYPNNK